MIAAQPREALALAASSFRLSYGQLNERSAGLAQGLQLLGVGADVPIAVFANRTPAGVLAALSVLKAGAGYVPLDPADPAERLEFVLRDVQAPFVLAERGLAGRLPKGRWKVIPLDEAPLLFSKPMDPLPAPGPNNLAYIGYTSGSTGRPLGVEITHAGLMNLIRWHQRAFHVTAADNASQLAAPGFDGAVWEIWPYLTVGANLHFPDAHVGRAGRPLRDWLVDEYITIAFAPTALAEQLIALEWPRPHRPAHAAHGRRRPAALSARRPALHAGEQLWPDRSHRGGHFRTGAAASEPAGISAYRPSHRQRAGRGARRVHGNRCATASPASSTSAARAWRAAM